MTLVSELVQFGQNFGAKILNRTKIGEIKIGKNFL